MLDFKGVKKVMKKLEGGEEGEVQQLIGRGGEYRFSYYLHGQLMFIFGITRGSRKKSKHFHYIPRQMLLTHSQYK